MSFEKKKAAIVYLCCICLLGILFLDSGTASANQPRKKRIAVVDFENHTKYRNAGSGIADLLVVELVKNRNFEVLERSKLNQLLKEQYHGNVGIVSEESAAKLGQLLGLDYLVLGSVTDISGSQQNILGVVTDKISVNLSMRFVDATTGSIIFADNVEGVVKSTWLLDSNNRGNLLGSQLGSDAIAEASKKAVVKIVNKINETNPLEGVVVNVSGNTVYIDLGRDDGVQQGQTYEVYKEGKVITHPVTGKIMGVERIKVGELKITGVEGAMSIGQAKGGAITIGCKVRKK